jgi:uncharacterized small protein (DUF1192 family)
MTIGSPEHRTQFIEDIKKHSAENIWQNDIKLLKLNDELALLQQELDKLNAALKKPAANAEKKQVFVLEQNIKHQEADIAKAESDKKYNEYLLNDLIPRYEKSL